jgi:hypothetical protein
MVDIVQLQIDIISRVTQMVDPVRLQQMYAIASAESDDPLTSATDVFQKGEIHIRSGVSKEMVFPEQDKPVLLKEEYEDLIGDLEWQHTSEELLTFID